MNPASLGRVDPTNPSPLVGLFWWGMVLFGWVWGAFEDFLLRSCLQYRWILCVLYTVYTHTLTHTHSHTHARTEKLTLTFTITVIPELGFA